jgi:hypothetical protein
MARTSTSPAAGRPKPGYIKLIAPDGELRQVADDIAEGGEVLGRVELREDRAPFALMLGGPDRRTLFILTAEWRNADGVTDNLERLANGPRTREILTLPVSVPGTGRP